MKRILVIYYHRFARMRETTRNHIFCFGEHKGIECYFLNIGFGVPNYITRIPFDLVIFQTDILYAIRDSPDSYETWLGRLQKLRSVGQIRVMLPQDEYYRSNCLTKFIQDLDIRLVLTIANEKDQPRIYAGVFGTPDVSFHKVLTGYLPETLSSTIQQLENETAEHRVIDIGYRAWRNPFWLGQHGMLKVQVADLFLQSPYVKDLRLDISNEDKKTFFGQDWYRFLLKCKYTLGVEGGSSVLDVDGQIRSKVQSYILRNPAASFEQVREICFPGQDGFLDYLALSPRHLEACATKTCQILVEGHYNGILKPWHHYIPLRKNFSNLSEVIEIVKQDKLRHEIVERAYRDIVLSGNYTHKALVNTVTRHCQISGATQCSISTHLLGWQKLRNNALGWLAQVEGYFWQIFKHRLSPKAISWLKKTIRPVLMR